MPQLIERALQAIDAMLPDALLDAESLEHSALFDDSGLF